MSNLFKLKEWFTVPDAAKHLAIVFGEEITEADVFRLALDKKLTLSIHLSKRTGLKRVEIIPIPEELKYNITHGNSMLCVTDYEIIYLDGIFDLPLIELERSIVEAEYYRAINGKATELTESGSIIIEQDNQLFMLQDHFKSIKLVGYEGIDCKEEFLRRYAADYFYEAQCLPEHGALVVRTDALRGLEDSMKETTEKPLATNERYTLLTIIAALCDYSAIRPEERGAATQIARLTEEIGVPVSDDAIGRALKKSLTPSKLEVNKIPKPRAESGKPLAALIFSEIL